MSHESPLEPSDITASVVRALVLYSLAEFQSGHVRTIRVTAKGSSFSVEDDGRGHAISRTVEGSPYLRFIYTHLEYPYEPGQGKPVQLHGIGMSLLNTLCAELTVTVRKPDALLQMRFRRGHLIDQEVLEADSDDTGNTISGVVDAEHARPDVDEHNLDRWLCAILAASPALRLYFNGQELAKPTAGDA